MSIQKLGPGQYRVWLFLGRDANGKQLRRSEVVKGTKADAEKRERELRRALDTGTFVDPKAGTVAEFMARWLASVKDKRTEKTYERYEGMVRNQIVPDLGWIKLSDLRPLHIEAAEAKWVASGNHRTGKPTPLSAQSVLHLHRCLHTAFERAVKWRLLAVNPVNGVEAPSVPRTEAGFLVPEEAVRLLDVIRGSEFELPILVGLYGGLRPSEYLALRWADLDERNGELRVTQTVRRVRNGHTAFERAVKWRLLAVNPVNGVEAPSVPRTEAGFLVPEEAVRLLDVVRGSEFELPVMVGLYGGLRPSEYLALRWADLDERNGELRVTQTVTRVRNGRVTEWDGVEVEGFAFGPTKTHRSMRPVAIPNELVALLLAWKPVQAELRLRRGPAWLDLDLIFTDSAGQPLDIRRLRKFLYAALAKAKVRRRKLYSLRHTMASLMLLRRESPKVVAARLGHANETLVLRTYGHLIPGMDRDAADRLAETLRGAQFTQSAHDVQQDRGA